MADRDTPGVQAALHRGIEHHQHGRLHDAEALYRQVLQAQPRQADALHLLGLIALQRGQAEDACALIRQALAVRPADNFHCNLGNALKALGRYDEAIASYRQALALNPQLVEALSNLGDALLSRGAVADVAEAAACCRRAVALRPGFAAAHCNLGNALVRQGDAPGAIASYEQALRLAPGLAVVQANLAEAHVHEAIACRQVGDIGTALGHALQAAAHADTPAVRAACVQTLRNAHFQTPQPAVRALLLRALDDAWCDPGELLTPACSLVACSPAIVQGLACVRNGQPVPAAVQAALASDALLHRLLEADVLASVPLERVLTAVRSQWLEQSTPDAALLPLQCAVARQSFINDHAWWVAPREAAQLSALRAVLARLAEAGTQPAPHLVAIAACYAPLSTCPGAAGWAALHWPETVAALCVQQLIEPATEQRLLASLPTLGNIDDAVSQQVRAQYEVHPYPRWVRMARPAATVDLRDWLRRQFPMAPVIATAHPDRLDVLVAGCGTGQHALRVATQFRGANVLAVDLSRASLGHALRKTHELGVRNIRCAQADILALGTLAERFDLIETSGVLHHMADPVAGWRVLLQLLRPGGCMAVGLYSALGRRSVVAARERLGTAGLTASVEDIRTGRQLLLRDDVAPQFERLLASRDVHAISACRDLLFHVQEHRFTLPQLQAVLAQLGLEFLGFELDADVLSAYRARHPADPAATDLAQWHAFEQAEPDTFERMYQFWVRKPA